jgi:hypothetical protein
MRDRPCRLPGEEGRRKLGRRPYSIIKRAGAEKMRMVFLHQKESCRRNPDNLAIGCEGKMSGNYLTRESM